MKPAYCKSNSISYREAQERQRLSFERLVEGSAGLVAFRVAAAVWTLTSGYSKAWDQVFVDALADMTGMHEREVRRGIKECEKVGALQWRPSRWRHGTPSLIGLPDHETGLIQPGLTGVDSGLIQPDYLEPRTKDSPGESTESGEWRASIEGPSADVASPSGTATDQENGVNADELARWQEANRPKPEPRAAPACSECGGPLGYEIADDESAEGLKCLPCFNGWSK